ncbi:MAG: ABC transporter permease [Bacteroidales bacterium]|nr:ABC transporter permease [Bacteroidales bacterium]
MKQFWVFVNKEFMHIFRDTRTVMILLLMPVVQIILFGFALSNEVKDVKFAVLDHSKDAVTTFITERISQSEYFIFARDISTEEEADYLIKSSQVSLVVVYDNNFRENIVREGKSQISLVVDGSDPNTASGVLRYANSIIASSNEQILRLSGFTPHSADKPTFIEPVVELLYNPQMKSAYNFVPGVMGLILMLICAMMTSVSIVREKEIGTMEVLLASPVRPVIVILAKTVPYFILSVINLATILLLSVFVLGVPITGSIYWLVLASFIFIFVSLSTGLLISSFASTQVAAMLISGLVFMMPVMLLSGMIYPVSNMPYLLQVVAQFIPAKWFIEAVRKLMIQGLPVTSVFKELFIMTSMAVSFTVLSIRSFKQRLE